MIILNLVIENFRLVKHAIKLSVLFCIGLVHRSLRFVTRRELLVERK